MKAETAVIAVSAVGTCAAAVMLLRAVRALEGRLASVEDNFETTTKQQQSVLQWLTQRMEAIDVEVRTGGAQSARMNASVAGGVTPPGRDALSKVSSPAGSIARPPSWESMLSEAGGGYKTAEEGDGPEEPAAANRASSAGTRSGPTTPAGARAQSGGPASPAALPAAWPASGASGSWSCVGTEDQSGGAAGAAAPAGATPAPAPAAPGPSSSDAAADAAASVLSQADELYKRNEFEAASSLLTSVEPETVETLWRRCRLNKELADVAKAAGKKKETERLLCARDRGSHSLSARWAHDCGRCLR